ncbi:FhaB protein [Vibrio parahaemolyticus]|uniref:FhaB protein n=1 Tax=Vibrio parahaemolyticus TaxID=670 RepID=UPI001D15F4B9|nr:FhaB protein [Vibrio parahaemolyticus]EGR2759430.1 FhaB protein [Vibrio parahaemolyticus]EJE4181457.1 FhaB protein [Vibrio parahaemolyticus]ELZ7232193.1 FhaB protein [Vibrio parahaemolyticus]MCC3782822.1 FhaB protein [Vibrio parahaemolyticus]
METKSVRKSAKIAVFSLVSASLLSSHVLASSYGLSSRTDTQVRQSSSSNFDVLVPAKAKNGISYNVFSKFELSGKPVTLVNTDDTSGGVRGTGKADLIVIESNNISLKEQFTILGSPADILFVTRSSSGKLSCEQCSFDNVGRVTMAVATPSYASNAKTINSVGDLTTVGGGKVTIKGLVSPGLQSLELIAENIDTSGTIDTNLRAENHPESGMIIVDRGSKVVGAGGINLFTGRLKVSYANLAIKSATLSTAWSTIKGKFRAATIAVASPNNIAVDADMSTMSDALSTSQHRGKLYAPTEGIFVQSLGKYKNPSHQNIHISANAKLSTDNHLSLKSLSTIRILKQGNKQAKVIGGDMTLIARNDVHQQGYVAADEVKVSANQFINNGVVESANIDVETEKSIYNSFGGKVLGKNVTLYSKSGAVINGSRTDKAVYLDEALTIGGEGYEVKKQFGIWQALKDHSAIKSANSASNLSASILADNLDIQAKRIENINPYHLEKSNSVNWDAGIRVNGIKANQVAIEAERSLKLKASAYVLNSSAIMGLNGGGEFLVNSPIFSNERYEISFESYPYRVVEYSQDDSKKNEIGHYKSGTETKILTYSPPGRVFSFGDFQFSRGGTSDPKKVQSSKLFNEVSYFQAFKDARFFNSTIKSIGLEIGTDTENTDFEGMTSCLNYRRCNREYVTTRTEAETLLSFEGNVFGVNGEVATESDLIIDNINSLETDKKNIILNIVNNYISINKAKIDEHPNNILVRYLNSMYSTFTYEYRLSNVEVVSDVVKGEVLVYVAYTSKPSNWPKGHPWSDDYKDFTKWQYSKPYKFEVNWKEKYDEEQGEKEFGSTGYTLTQIEEAAKTYLQVTSFIKASTNNRYGKLLYSYIDLDSVEVFKELDSDTITIKYLQRDKFLVTYYKRLEYEEKQYLTKKVNLAQLIKYLPVDYLGSNLTATVNDSNLRAAISNYLRTIPTTVDYPKNPYRGMGWDVKKFDRTTYRSHKVIGNNVEIEYTRIVRTYGCISYAGCGWANRAIYEKTKLTKSQLSHYL